MLGWLVPRPEGRKGFKGAGRNIRVSTCLLYCYAQPNCSAVRYYNADHRRLMVCVLLQLLKRAPDCPRGAEGWCKHLLPCTFELVPASLIAPRGCPDTQGEQHVLWPHRAEASHEQAIAPLCLNPMGCTTRINGLRYQQAAPAVLLDATRQPATTSAPTTPEMPRAAMATGSWVSRLTRPDVNSSHHVHVRYAASDVILGGGLNNMLLHLAQLLEQACASNATLVLPFLHADPLEKHPQKTCKVEPGPGPGHRQCKAFALSDVFDLDYLRARVPCSMTEDVPAGAAVTLLKLDSINAFWDHGRPMVAHVYAAVRPSTAVQALLDRLLEMAAVQAGHNWSAVHMP